MENLSSEYWNDRYKNGTAAWDIKSISTPIKEYIDQLENKTISILIPGCGYGYEGEYLLEKGFSNVHLLDFASKPLEAFQKRNLDFPNEQLHQNDFFKHEGTYDLILEQTLFCAIDPVLRPEYAKKVSGLLKNGGKLVGLFFDREFEGGPPFGGNRDEYMKCFTPYFSSILMDKCYNSIPPRKDSELFLRMMK